MRLAGKVALITGSARGIGRGIAIAFAREGAQVGVLDLYEASCQEVVEEIKAFGGQAVAIGADVTDEASIAAAVEKLQQTFGTISVLINNAAVMPTGRVDNTAPEDFDRCIAVNFRGAYLCSRAVVPMMLEAKQGSIIHMASVTGMLGLPGLAIYSATKGALIALARAMSTDYARLGVRVNTISPGTIDTPMLHNFLMEQSEANRARIRQEFDDMHPIGRIGTIDEVAKACIFLASDDASFITGANYVVDGGLSSRGEQPQD